MFNPGGITKGGKCGRAYAKSRIEYLPLVHEVLLEHQDEELFKGAEKF
jgi:hypothetical protein